MKNIDQMLKAYKAAKEKEEAAHAARIQKGIDIRMEIALYINQKYGTCVQVIIPEFYKPKDEKFLPFTCGGFRVTQKGDLECNQLYTQKTKGEDGKYRYCNMWVDVKYRFLTEGLVNAFKWMLECEKQNTIKVEQYEGKPSNACIGINI